MKKLPTKCSRTLYRKDFYFVDRLHGSALHSDQCTAGCVVHTNFADESAFLTADNIWNEVVTMHRSQEVLKMLSLYTEIFLQLIVSLKNTGTTILLALQHTRHQLSLDGAGLCGLDVDSVNSSRDYFVYLCIPANETTLHQKRMSIVD
jgi:hypothetical protein